MKGDPSITAAYVREKFWYDPETGVLYRKSNGRPFGTIGTDGYLRGAVKKNNFQSTHIIIWLFHYGEWPSQKLDHKNRNRLDNRLSNLRLATDSQNSCNTTLRKTSTSGIKGVSYSTKQKGRKKWRAYVAVNKKTICLGFYETKEEARLARELGAAKAHGEFFSN